MSNMKEWRRHPLQLGELEKLMLICIGQGGKDIGKVVLCASPKARKEHFGADVQWQEMERKYKKELGVTAGWKYHIRESFSNEKMEPADYAFAAAIGAVECGVRAGFYDLDSRQIFVPFLINRS